MFRAYILVFQALSLVESCVHGLLHPWSYIDLPCPMDCRHILQFFFKVFQDRPRVGTQFIKYGLNDTILLRHEGIEEMFIVNTLMI